MERDGKTTAWLRDENGKWSDAGQVKFSEDYDRANHRFADVDGKRNSTPLSPVSTIC